MSLSSDFLWVVDIHQPTALLPTSDTRFCSSYLHLWEHSCQYAEQALGNSSYAFVFKLKVCIFNRSGRRFLWWEMLLLKAQSYGFFFLFCLFSCLFHWLVKQCGLILYSWTCDGPPASASWMLRILGLSHQYLWVSDEHSRRFKWLIAIYSLLWMCK